MLVVNSVEKGIVMIRLSNGDQFKYVVASGALAFDGLGWFWERILVFFGCIKPELFLVILKTLTRYPVRGNLRWWAPWRCVALIFEGAVNKVGLTNRGIDWWCKYVGPYLNYKKYRLVASIFGDIDDLVYMAEKLNQFDLAAIEINDSCPNASHESEVDSIINALKAVKKVCRHDIILKLSCDQDYLAIAKRAVGLIVAIDLNSVKWEIAFPGKKSPLAKLEKKVGKGGGGVSGKPAQKHNWPVVKALAEQGLIPVIASSMMEFEDIAYAFEKLKAGAVSFGTRHLPSYPIWENLWTIFTNPCKPTRFVRKALQNDITQRQKSIPGNAGKDF